MIRVWFRVFVVINYVVYEICDEFFCVCWLSLLFLFVCGCVFELWCFFCSFVLLVL